MAAQQFAVITLFPELFVNFANTSLVGRAIESGLLALHLEPLRKYGLGKHLSVDDTPYGGGSGMLMRVDCLVAALEALDQPSRVTLVTTSSQVQRGLRDGLRTWRNNGWRWESYGRLVPIKHADLWQRIDRALEFHRVECRMVRIDGAHSALSPAKTADRRQQRGLLFWHPLSALWQAAHRLWLRLARGLVGAQRPWNARPFGPASA